MVYSEIQNFYKNQTIFITGVTGSLGRLLVEKLLRSCYDLKKIYVMVRPKKGKSPEDRFDEIFELDCFTRLKNERPAFKEKVVLIRGDCKQPDLNLNERDRNILIQEVTCIIHAAADVKFEQHLRSATYINVRAVRDILNLAKEISQLKLFLYVSTAFSNCPEKYIKEQFYEPPVDAERLLQLVEENNDEVLKDITPRLLGKWPNTYVFSKAVAEDLVRKECQNITRVIVRPAIISSTYREPFPGYIDEIYGLEGILLGGGLGVTRILNTHEDNILFNVFFDYTVNHILAVGWYTHCERSQLNCNVKIYNYVGSRENPMTFGKLRNIMYKQSRTAPTEKVIWYPRCMFTMNNYIYSFITFWLYLVIPQVVDLIFRCLGKKPSVYQNATRYNKLLSELRYFTANKFDFESNNVEHLWTQMSEFDRSLFNFNMVDTDYEKSYMTSVLYFRKHFLKESEDSIPKTIKKIYFLIVLHYLSISVLCFLIFKVTLWLVSLFL